MKNKYEVEYNGYWIELTEQQDDGLFLAGIRITNQPPEDKKRIWSSIETDRVVFFDFDAAAGEALEQAKAHIDASQLQQMEVA